MKLLFISWNQNQNTSNLKDPNKTKQSIPAFLFLKIENMKKVDTYETQNSMLIPELLWGEALPISTTSL